MKNKKHQLGQVTVELVLILIVFTAISVATQRFFQENEVIKTMVSKPWNVLSGMLQNGAWKPVKDSNFVHPNQKERRLSLRGETGG